MNAYGSVCAGGFGAFWLGKFGPATTIQQLRDTYFPNSMIKTMAKRGTWPVGEDVQRPAEAS